MALAHDERIVKKQKVLAKVDCLVFHTTWEQYFQTIRPQDDPDFAFAHTDAPYGNVPNPADAIRCFTDTVEDSDFFRFAPRIFKCLKSGS